MPRRTTTTLTLALFALAITTQLAFAATGTIIPPDQYAWSDNGGYVNWDATSSNVTITDTALTGYIWSAGFGWINLAPTEGGVTNNNGVLGGSAWGTNTGWINFTGVTIDSSGVFHGHTTAQPIFGTMTFDCAYCTVTTTWHAAATANAGGGGSGGSGGGGNGPVSGSSSGASPIPTSASATSTTTSAENQSLVASLQAQIQQLTAQLATLEAAHGSTYTFTRNLTLGSTGAEVKKLQQYLNLNGYPIALSGTGSPGFETSYFGPATLRALKKFQAAHNVTASGYFGPLTRALIQTLTTHS